MGSECENWKEIDEWYDVSDRGNVRSWRMGGPSKKKRLEPKLLKSSLLGEYPGLKLGRSRAAYIHRLVLEAFVGPCPEGMECRHLDGDRFNNTLTNLCWDTYQVNANDRIRHGTQVRGEDHGRAKLTQEVVDSIRARHTPGKKTGPGTPKALAAELGMDPVHICRILNFRRWSKKSK